MVRRLLLLVAVAGAAAIALGPDDASAQGRRTVVFEEDVIVGKVQKPSIQILITRQNLNSNDELVLRESFIPRIVESVEKKPF